MILKFLYTIDLQQGTRCRLCQPKTAVCVKWFVKRNFGSSRAVGDGTRKRTEGSTTTPTRYFDQHRRTCRRCLAPTRYFLIRASSSGKICQAHLSYYYSIQRIVSLNYLLNKNMHHTCNQRQSKHCNALITPSSFFWKYLKVAATNSIGFKAWWLIQVLFF